MNFNGASDFNFKNTPVFIKESERLIRLMRKYRISDIIKLMNISHKLAETNYNWFQEWQYPYDLNRARPALFSFTGDVYDGFKARELSFQQIELADKKVRILSGLYGILKPTDLILPYRLEMATVVSGNNFNNLYDFWKSKLTRYLEKELKSTNSNTIVNLASLEYTNAIDLKKLKADIITPSFLEFKNGEFKFVSINAKKARGLMTRYIIEENIEDTEHLKLFTAGGYSFDDKLSKKNKWVFIK